MKNLKTLRQNQSVSQYQVALALGIPATTYATYEQNKATPSEGTLIKIADYFGCSIDYLLGHETKGIIHLDSLTPLQQKIFNMVKTLNDDQATQVISICSYVLGASYNDLKPQRPW